MVFVNRKDISAKCIFAAVSSLFLTDSSHFYLQEPLLVLCLVPRRKGAPGSGSEAGTQRQTCAEGRCRDGLQHLTVHKHRRAFVDFSQNAPVKHATNRGKKKKKSEGQAEQIIAARRDLGKHTARPGTPLSSALGSHTHCRQSSQLCKRSPQVCHGGQFPS